MKKHILLFFSLFGLLLTSSLTASTYYWVGNGGNWSDYNAHWATTSGGLIFFNQPPTISDDVVFDNNSFTVPGQIVNIDGSISTCRSFTIQPTVTNSPTFIAAPGHTSLQIYGSFTLQSSVLWSYNAILTFKAASGIHTIKSAGRQISEIDLENTNGAWIQTDSLPVTTLRINAGSFSTSNFPLKASGVYFGTTQANSFDAGTSRIYCDGWAASSFGMSTIDADSCTISVTIGFTNSGGRVFNKVIVPSYATVCSIGTDSCTIDSLMIFGQNVFLNGRNSNINRFYAQNAITANQPSTYHTAEFRGNVVFAANASSTFDTLYLNNGGSTLSLASTAIITINGTIRTSSAPCAGLVRIISTTSGQQATFHKTSGAVICSGLSLKDIKKTGAATFTANNSVNEGNVTGWVVNSISPRTIYWVGNSGSWTDAAHWSNISGGPGGACPPTLVDSIIFDANSMSIPNQTVSISQQVLSIYCINAMGLNFPTIFSSNMNIICTGSLQLPYNLQWISASNNILMSAISGTHTIQLGGNQFDDIVFNGTGRWNWLDSAYCSYLTISRGRVDLQMNFLSCEYFSCSPSSPVTLKMGNTTLQALSATFGSSSFLTLDADSSQIRVAQSFVSSGNHVFDTVISYYANPLTTEYIFQAGQINHLIVDHSSRTVQSGGIFKKVQANENLTLRATNTHIENLDARKHVYLELDAIVDTLRLNNPNYAVTLKTYKTLTVESIIASGSCSGTLTLQSADDSYMQSTSSLDQGFIVSASPSINVDGLLISNIGASGGAVFNATNSITNGIVTGWNISNTGSGTTYYWINGQGNWYDPAHWSLTSGGAPASCIPHLDDDVVFDVNSFTWNDTVNLLDGSAFCHNITCTGISVTPVFSGTLFYSPAPLGGIYISGNMLIQPGISWPYEGRTSFVGQERGRQIAAGGTRFTNVRFDGQGGSWILTDSLGYQFYFLNHRGYLDINGQTIRGNAVLELQDTTDLGAASILIGQSLFITYGLNTSGPFFDADSAFISCGEVNGDSLLIMHLHYDNSNNINSFLNIPLSHVSLFTLSGDGTTDINGTDSMYFDKIIAGAPLLISNAPVQILYGDFREDLTIQTHTAIDTLILNNPGYNFLLPANDSVIVSDQFLTNGSAALPINMTSTQNGTQANLLVLSDTVCMEYMRIQDVNATGGAVFYAGFYSTDFGNNTGLSFTACSIPVSTVWPGDANNDLTVDNSDLLNIGLAYNESGFVRPGATTNWQAETCVDWNRIFGSGLNISHADCDGNGMIDSTDLAAVYLNYGQTHPPIAPPGNPASAPRSGENIFLDPFQFNYSPGDFVTIPVKLGTSIDPADDIYGTAYKITYDNSKIISGSVSISFPSSWFTPAGNRINLQKDFFGSGIIHGSQSRINLTNITGDGTIAYLHFQIDPGASGQINLDMIDVVALDKDENPITLIPAGTIIYIMPPLAASADEFHANAEVYPNPSPGDITLHYQLKVNTSVMFSVYDLTGNCVFREAVENRPAGDHNMTIAMANLSAGIYTCRFAAGDFIQTFKLVKTN